MKKLTIVAALLVGMLLPVAVHAQTVTNAPDCLFPVRTTGLAIMTAVGTSGLYDNRSAGCTDWTLTYTTYGFTAPTIEIVSAPNSTGSPGTAVAFSGNVLGATQPVSAGSSGTIIVSGYVPYVGVSIVSKSGTGALIGTLSGYRPGNVRYATTAISATAAVNTATTLTIPAPPAGMYNYVCSLSFEVNNDNTATAVSNVVSTSTNFNSFAVKFSAPATASIDTFVPVFQQSPPGCTRSAATATTTTFVSPAGLTHSAWTWYASFYQAP